MYFVGTRRLNINGEFRAPGEPVPEAMGWSYPVLVAHLNLDWLVKRDEVKRTAKKKAKRKTAKKKRTKKKT